MLARRDQPSVEARLYGVSFSYPSLAARLMLQHKGIEHEWGNAVRHPFPRRLLRWGMRHRPDARVMLARGLGSHRPELVARFIGPVAAFYARREDARSSERVRA